MKEVNDFLSKRGLYSAKPAAFAELLQKERFAAGKLPCGATIAIYMSDGAVFYAVGKRP